MRLLRIGLALALFCAALGVWLGFAGRLHPLGDSVSLFRVVLGAVCLLGCLWQIGLIWRAMLGLTAAAALLTTLPLFWGSGVDGELTVYSKNLWYRNNQVAAVAADMRESGAEVIALQEVSGRNLPLLDALSDTHPYQHLCRFSGWSGVAVLSKYPITDQTCSDRRGIAVARIDRAGEHIWVGSVHLKWPFPYANAHSSRAVKDVLNGLDGPVVLAGDFNIFPWANSVRQLQRSANMQPAQPIRPTFSLRGTPLFLDHIHAPGGGSATYRGLLGSDHLGVLAQVRLSR